MDAGQIRLLYPPRALENTSHFASGDWLLKHHRALIESEYALNEGGARRVSTLVEGLLRDWLIAAAFGCPRTNAGFQMSADHVRAGSNFQQAERSQ